MKFFAEGLPRLGIVNLQIHLDASPVSHLTLSVTAGDQKAVLCHGEESFVLGLPAPASSTEKFTYPAGQSEITSRISTERSTSNEESTSLLSAEDIASKWQQGARLSCRNCHQDILSNPQMRWKDLPSESWAEYSDYWLCHPGGSHSHSHSHSHISRSPEPRTNHPIPNLTARPGLGLVGLTSILVDPKDLQNILLKVNSYSLPTLDSKKAPLCLRNGGAPIQKSQIEYPLIPFSCGFVAILKFNHANDKGRRRGNIKR
jgi:hypothetical protein